MDPPSFFFSSSSFSSHPFLCKFFPYFLQSDNLSLSLYSKHSRTFTSDQWLKTDLSHSIEPLFLHLTFLLRRGKENFRQMEKKILDSIIGPTNNYDSRIRPSGDNSTGDIGQYYGCSIHSWHSFTTITHSHHSLRFASTFSWKFSIWTHTYLTKSSSSHWLSMILFILPSFIDKRTHCYHPLVPFQEFPDFVCDCSFKY